LCAAIVHIDRRFAERLHGVGVERHTAFAANRRQLFDRLNRASLVIRGHDRHEHGVVADCFSEIAGINKTVAAHGQIGHFAFAGLFEVLTRMQDGMVLDAAGDDVAAPALAGRPDHAKDCGIVGLGAAAGEHNLAFLRAEQLCDPNPSVVNRGTRFATENVNAAGISEMFLQIRQHRFQRFWSERSGRVVVGVNAFHGPNPRSECRNPKQYRNSNS
jgi:hypothetical protein